MASISGNVQAMGLWTEMPKYHVILSVGEPVIEHLLMASTPLGASNVGNSAANYGCPEQHCDHQRQESLTDEHLKCG